jgi:hypothetical protein
MPFTTWIRDALGIRKDIVDTKKAELEITKLEDEQDERRGLIQLATLDDVKEYDEKVKQIVAVATEAQPAVAHSRRRNGLLAGILTLLILLALIGFYLGKLLHYLFG